MKPAVIPEFFARLKKAIPEPETELEYENVYHLLVAVVLSAQHSSEDNFVVLKVARDLLGARRVYLAALDAGKSGWKGDEILRHHDNNPNRAGAIAVTLVSIGLFAAFVAVVFAFERV